MSEIDVEVMRQRYDNWVLGVETLDHYITPDDVSAMLDEIVALRKQVEDQRLELCRYDDAWCETDEERQLRPRS